MNQQRDQIRTPIAPSAPAHDDDLAPGRGNRSSQLAAPSQPIAGGLLLRKARDANGVAEGADQTVAAAASSSSHPLPDAVMRKFESSLGADLSSVRVHTGAESQAAAESVGARAYTVGQDIHFGAGQYDPGSAPGQHLLAHEIAHTVQQRGAAPSRQNKLAVSQSGDSLEVEADRAASAMVSGTPTTVSGGSQVIARDKKEAESEAKSGPGGSAGVDTKKGTVTGEINYTFKLPPVKLSKIACTAETSVKVAGSLTLSSTSDDAGSKKPTAADARTAGQELARKHYEEEGKPEDFIQSWEFEAVDASAKPGMDRPGKGGIEVGLAPTIVLKTRKGGVIKLGVKVVSLEKAAPDKPVGLEILTASASEEVPVYQIPDGTMWNNFKISGGLKLTAMLDLKPDKMELAAKIIERFGPRLLGKVATETAGTAVRTAAEVLASLPAIVGVAGVYITVKATMASLKEGDDLKSVAGAADNAARGYAGGFSAAVGGTDMAGDPAWHAAGAADAARMLAEQIAKIQATPEFVQYNFSTEELRAGIIAKVAGRAELYNAVLGGARPRIQEAYVAAWRAQLGTWDKLFTNTDFDETLLRADMGQGRPFEHEGGPAAEMPAGADTGIEKAEEDAE